MTPIYLSSIKSNCFYFATDFKLWKRHFFVGMNLLPFEKQLFNVVNLAYLITEISVAYCKVLKFLKEKKWEKIQQLSTSANKRSWKI